MARFAFRASASFLPSVHRTNAKADCIEQGPLSWATRKTFALTEFFSV